MPSHGFYIRHVKGIQFDKIDIRPAQPEQRPAFLLEDVQGAEFFRVPCPHGAGAPVFVLNNVADCSVQRCAGVKDTDLPKVTDTTLYALSGNPVPNYTLARRVPPLS